MNEQATSLTLLSVTQAVGVFTALLPPISEVRKSNGDLSTKEDVRKAELTAGVLVIAVGLVASAFAKSPVPAMAAILSAAAIAAMYEPLLQTPPKEATA